VLQLADRLAPSRQPKRSFELLAETFGLVEIAGRDRSLGTLELVVPPLRSGTVDRVRPESLQRGADRVRSASVPAFGLGLLEEAFGLVELVVEEVDLDLVGIHTIAAQRTEAFLDRGAPRVDVLEAGYDVAG